MSVQDEIPKSRLTLTYKTEVDGEPETVNLPLRLLALGDFSLGSSKDRQEDLDERRIRSLDGTNTDDMMEDMGMKLSFVVPNKVDPGNGEQIRVNLPIDSMNSFTPDAVAENVPKIRSLLLLRKLLLEVQSNVANKKEFRNLLRDLYADEDAYNKVLGELKEFEGFKLPTGPKAITGPEDGEDAS